MSVFKKLQSGDIIIGRVQTVSSGIFPGGAAEWTSFSTDADQIVTKGSSELDPKSGLYYYDVYTSTDEETKEIAFSVTYGSLNGTGSSDLDRSKYKIFPTKAIYTQYKNLILTPDDDVFSFISGSGTNAVTLDSSDIYVINFSADKTQEKVDPGLIEFTLYGTNGYFTFVDDSPNESSNKSVYNIVLGSIQTSTADPVVGNPIGVGLFYPSLGVVVLNPSKLAEIVGTITLTPQDGTTDYALNHNKLFQSIRDGANNRSFKARSSEFIPSRQFFVRVKNSDFNYSNNPTFVKDPDVTGVSSDEGKILYSDFYNDPHVYITTIGLYDDNNELIATAKLSQPLEKTFDSEALVKIKLDI